MNTSKTLIDKVNRKLKNQRLTHIVIQIHHHLREYKRTGKGAEVLEHYISHPREYLNKVFYFEGKVLDTNNQTVTYYSKANSTGEWKQVKIITFNNTHVKKYLRKMEQRTKENHKN